MFSCEFCAISRKTYFNRTPPVDASDVRFALINICNSSTESQQLEIIESFELCNICRVQNPTEKRFSFRQSHT